MVNNTFVIRPCEDESRIGFALGITVPMTMRELTERLVEAGVDMDGKGRFIITAPETIEATVMNELAARGMNDVMVLKLMNVLDAVAAHDDNEDSLDDWPIRSNTPITSRSIPGMVKTTLDTFGYWVNMHGYMGLLLCLYLAVRTFGECGFTITIPEPDDTPSETQE